MSHELPPSPSSCHWLSLVAASAARAPTHHGERWLLHLTPSTPQAKTTTMQVRWSGAHWQLLSISNAGDWPSMHHLVDELCFDPRRNCFWCCQAGPVVLSEQPRVLANFLADLQHTCTHHGFTVESGPLHQRSPKMSTQPKAVELETINRDDELQAAYDSGLAVHGYKSDQAGSPWPPGCLTVTQWDRPMRLPSA